MHQIEDKSSPIRLEIPIPEDVKKFINVGGCSNCSQHIFETD
jgi:hypothetical protein